MIFSLKHFLKFNYILVRRVLFVSIYIFLKDNYHYLIFGYSNGNITTRFCHMWSEFKVKRTWMIWVLGYFDVVITYTSGVSFVYTTFRTPVSFNVGLSSEIIRIAIVFITLTIFSVIFSRSSEIRLLLRITSMPYSTPLLFVTIFSAWCRSCGAGISSWRTISIAACILYSLSLIIIYTYFSCLNIISFKR